MPPQGSPRRSLYDDIVVGTTPHATKLIQKEPSIELASPTETRRMRLSGSFLALCLVVLMPISYYAGGYWKQHYAASFVSERHVLLSNARRTRQTHVFSKKGTHSSEAGECSHPVTGQIEMLSVVFDTPLQQHYTHDRTDLIASHMLMDNLFVDAELLSSEARMELALVDFIWEASTERNLGLESYHCQTSAGITCIAILNDAQHLTVSTDPARKRLVLDLFATGQDPLIGMIPLLQKHFGVPMEGRPLARSQWGHFLRGERTILKHFEHDMSDLFFEAVGEYYYMEEVGSAQSDFQRIDVWDFLEREDDVGGYEHSMWSKDTYESDHPELFKRNRALFLDGVLQSTAAGDEAYHESLVHPAMFAHAGPKRVAIIGGGEGATLREVLKHNTVEHVKMIEIDEIMLESARKFLPAMNNCSDLIGSADNCFDDPRTDLICQDAFGWFMDRFKKYGGEVPRELQTEAFDVIIMDALDPEDNVEFAVDLYTDLTFWGSLYAALSEDGILIMQIGESPYVDDPAEAFGDSQNRAHLLEAVESVGFSDMHLYEESHCGFYGPWSFLIAFKGQSDWLANEAEIARKIHSRMLRTNAGKPALKFFDGSTMANFQVPSRAWENVFCRQDPRPAECAILRGFDQKTPIYNMDSFSVNNSTASMIAMVDIPRGAYTTNQQQAQHTARFTSSTARHVSRLRDQVPQAASLQSILTYMKETGFGHKISNHYLMNNTSMPMASFNDSEAERSSRIGRYRRSPHSPVRDRHLRFFSSILDVTDIAFAAGGSIPFMQL